MVTAARPPLGPGDTIMVVARRAGLGWLTKQATVPPVVTVPHQPQSPT